MSHEFVPFLSPQTTYRTYRVLRGEGAPAKIFQDQKMHIFLCRKGEALTDSPTQRVEPDITNTSPASRQIFVQHVALRQSASSKPKHKEAKSGAWP